MKRRTWGPRRTFIVLGLALASMTLFVAQFLKTGEDSAQPVILAIRQYRESRGFYPDSLDDVIKEGLLSSIPYIPSSVFCIRGQLDYFSDRDLDFFCLDFYEQPSFGGLGPARAETRAFVSFDGIWKSDSESSMIDFPHPLGLAMQCAGQRFLKSRARADLELFVKKAIEYSTSTGSYPGIIRKVEIIDVLGNGEIVEVDETPCLCYSSSELVDPARFCFLTTEGSKLFGVYSTQVAAIFRFDLSASPGEWREIFRSNE